MSADLRGPGNGASCCHDNCETLAPFKAASVAAVSCGFIKSDTLVTVLVSHFTVIVTFLIYFVASNSAGYRKPTTSTFSYTTSATDSELEAACKAEKSRMETLELFGATQLPESTNCLACSEDGRYLSLGHSRGLSVWCASSLICVAEWLEDRLEITSIQMTRMAETAYLLGTIDDMGTARVFAYHCDNIHPLSVVNIMEDINKRSICLTFELSQGGHYGVASISCNGAVWLEVYHFPTETWLKELEMAASQMQEPNFSGDLGMKWSPLSVATKLKPPKIPAGTTLEGPHEAQTTDLLTHYLVVDVDTWSRQREERSFNTGAEKTKETNKSPRRCTLHFLLSCEQFPGDTKAKSQPAELPVAVCVWWSGSHNLLQYLLQEAPRNKPDVEPMPDVLWPNAQEILCSAVSRCTRYIGLGLSNALLCVWDRQSGSPLSVVLMSATDSAFIRLQFVDYWPVSTDDSQTFASAEVRLLVVCKSGAIHTVTTGRGTQFSTTLLSERPKDSGDFPTITASVPFLQSLVLKVQRNGKVFLQDVINKTTVCFLIPPKTHLIATPCNPVYALNIKQQTLFIRGDQDPSYRASSEEDIQSQLFIFHFGVSDILRQYSVSPPESPQQQKTLSFASLEDTCNLYLQQRALSVDERNKAITQTWKHLQETAVMEQQGHSKAAAELLQ
ncbi:WD repeat-containing protein 93 [Toxotes jaculatrix]|uniref:WD repeat-containing protein 93 n=1 Tax=Toxotes jaculatrix TaxID=941984 RepID=UPI001B3B100B|nr:WD repeat-containing protein 93 [Toxotes jaculatrix]